MTTLTCQELVDELTVSTLAVDFGEGPSLSHCADLLSDLVSACGNEGRNELGQEVEQVRSFVLEAAQSSQKTVRKKAVELLEVKVTLFAASLAGQNGDGSRAPHVTLAPGDLADTEMVNELLADFVVNVRTAVTDLEQLIHSSRQGDSDATHEIKRRIHTLKGEAGMLGILPVERVLHVTETYLEQHHPVWEQAERLMEMKDWLSDRADELSSGRGVDADIDSIVQRLTIVISESELGMAAVEKAPAPPIVLPLNEPKIEEQTSVDIPWDASEADLVGEFLRESTENLATVDQVLLEIEQSGADAERINKLFRVFHTLKGVATFLHLIQITELSHTTETMLDKVRTGQLPPAGGVIDLVFDTTNVLRRLSTAVEKALEGGNKLEILPEVDGLIERTRRVTAGELPDSSKLAAQPGEKLGAILERAGVVTHSDVQSCLDAQQVTGRKLGEELVVRAGVEPKVVAQALRAQNQIATPTKLKEVVKVDLERVDRLVEAIGELVIVESMVSNAQEILELPSHIRTHIGQFAKITRELQELGMCMRMVPLRAEFQKMTRMVRDLARRSNKSIRVELRGESTEMDRSMVEQLADPLVHLIRNAVDHGIETAEERKSSGKPEVATVVLSAAHEGGKIVVEVSDDGRGINREAVFKKAVSRGLISESAVLSDVEIFDLLFRPGFSTAEQVTEISGRGVGMDVVKRNIEAIRGRITTYSSPGKGTTFRLILPLTLAIIDGMVVRCGGERFIVPTLSIVESLQPTEDMLYRVTGKTELVLVRGETLPLIRLDELLDVSGAERDPTRALLVIVESVAGRVAMLVDDVVMKQQVVIKHLGSGVEESQSFYAGAAILSNGRVGLILNVETIAGVTLRASCHSLEGNGTQYAAAQLN